jgi:hypothetical protein
LRLPQLAVEPRQRSAVAYFVSGAPVIPPIAAIDGTVGRFEGHRGDYRGAVQYQWIPQLMTYAQVATGFKGGGVNPRPFAPSQAFSHGPETMIGWRPSAMLATSPAYERSCRRWMAPDRRGSQKRRGRGVAARNTLPSRRSGRSNWNCGPAPRGSECTW